MGERRAGSPWGAFFDECPDPCWVLRVEQGGFVLETANHAWDESTGFDAAALAGRPLVEWMPTALWTPLLGWLLRTCATGSIASYEQEFVFVSGTRFWQSRIVPWPRAGPITHVLGISRDLTDITEEQRAIVASEQKFRRIAENAYDVVYRYRYLPERGFDYLSPSVHRVTGYSPQQHYASPGLGRENVHPDDRAMLEEFERAPRNDEVLLRWVRQDGSVVWTEARNVCVYDAEGKLSAIEGIARDVTQRKQREEERRGIEQRLMQTQRLESLGVLAGGVAHDFNNLLTGILGHVSLMRSEAPAFADSREHLEQIEQAAVQAADLCRQMLAYSGKGRLFVRDVNLSELVRETAHLLEVSISKRASLTFSLGKVPSISADPSQLRQLLMNLVSNASEALYDGEGAIGVSTGVFRPTRQELQGMLLADELPEATYVFLEVRDNGVGMSPEVCERIFEPFYTTKFTGRGLGLPAVLGIVRSHRGAIGLNSGPGRGSEFRAIFPVVESRQQRARVFQPSPIGTPGGTILVVDDDEIVRKVSARILRSMGLDSILATDGFDGVLRYQQHQREITAVLLDLIMPGLDGEGAFHQIRAIRPDVPVVIMSGFSEQDVIGTFADKKYVGFLKKPFTVQQLHDKLRVVMGPG